jgi:hypothetical protein
LKGRAAVARLAILGWEVASVPVQSVECKLAAIFAADIADYSRLMTRDEVDMLARLKAQPVGGGSSTALSIGPGLIPSRP